MCGSSTIRLSTFCGLHRDTEHYVFRIALKCLKALALFLILKRALAVYSALNLLLLFGNSAVTDIQLAIPTSDLEFTLQGTG